MASNASRGAAAKGRAKKWLIAQGFQVADLERVHWIFTPRGRLPTKRDQFGSDLLAMNGITIIFVQVKSGKSAIGGTFPAARRAFAEFTFPPGVRRWVLAWPPRARAPRIVDCESELQRPVSPAIPPERRDAKTHVGPSAGENRPLKQPRRKHVQATQGSRPAQETQGRQGPVRLVKDQGNAEVETGAERAENGEGDE